MRCSVECAIHLDCAAGWIIKTCSLPLTIFPHIFSDGERGIRHGCIIQGIKGAYRHGDRVTHFGLRSAACGIGGRGNLGDHLIARTREIVLLKAGIGVDVARGQVYRRVRRLFHRTKIRFLQRWPAIFGADGIGWMSGKQTVQ